MTPEQRRVLLRACPDSLGGNPRNPRTCIYHNGYVIAVDYCLKHDTGSGLITGIKELSNLPVKGLPSAVQSDIDTLILDWAKGVRDDMQLYLHVVEEALKEV